MFLCKCVCLTANSDAVFLVKMCVVTKRTASPPAGFLLKLYFYALYVNNFL